MSAGGFFCARQDDVEEEEEEELLLDSPNISRELADKVRGFKSENELVKYLVEEKPADLRFGRELEYLDTKQLDDYMSGLCLKLDIHGYEDRAKRLKYLYEILRGKLSKKENVFKIVVQFLMDMAQRPTGVTHLPLSSILYSPDPEEEDDSSSTSTNQNSEKQRALLQEILGDDHPSNTNTENNYLSDSSLSDWSDDSSDPCTSSKSNNSLPPNIRPIRTSSSFGDFSNIIKPKAPDPLKQEMEALRFWTNEKLKAVDYLNFDIRYFETVPLSSQPVISSRLVLQARFGEWWEWKQQQKKESSPPSTPLPLQIAFVEDCVRELLWQFTNCRPTSSPLFNEDWTVKSDLMVASLSKSTFDGIINKYGQVFKKLQILRNFQRETMSSSLLLDRESLSPDSDYLPPSKVYLNYSLGLHTIFIHITSKVAQIEKELLRLPRPLKEEGPAAPGCTTFLQFEQQTRSLQQIIELIFNIHSKCILPFENDNDYNDKPWLSSLHLISFLETNLILETRPRDHGCLLFLYVKCLEALFLEILSTLRTLQWDERYSLFVRNPFVHLNDINFWSECITIREEFEKEFGEKEFLFGGSFTPLTSLAKLLPKVLNILKTCEVFDQLEEDFTQILGDSREIKVECMMEEFLEKVMMEGDNQEEEVVVVEENEENEEEAEGHVDFFKHFHALGLGSSMAANCFRFLKDPKFLEATTQKRKQVSKDKISNRKRKGEYTFEDFLNLSKIPTKRHALILDKVLCKWFDPFCKSAKLKIEKIFKEFNVLECMTVFQEIILTVREDFAKGIIELASKDFQASQVYKYEDVFNRNCKFQKLLNHCYPDCREIFQIDFKLDSHSALNCAFEVTPKFPLNLIVSPQSVAGYIFIGRQLHRIRKSLWNVSSLSLKECCAAVKLRNASSTTLGNPPRQGMGIVGDQDVQNRMLMLRFCLVNFCFSLRSFFMLKIFSRDFSEYANKALWQRSNAEKGRGQGQGEDGGGGEGEDGEMEEHHYFDLDSMRKVHENYLEAIKTEMLTHPMIENVLISNLATMSESLRKHWVYGMKPATVLILEDTLKKCWRVVNDFDQTKYSPDFNQLSHHFGRPPSYLTN